MHWFVWGALVCFVCYADGPGHPTICLKVSSVLFAVVFSGFWITKASGALLHHDKDRIAFSEHAKQYRQLEGIFSRASALVKQSLLSNDLHWARECLRMLLKEALEERGDWVLLYRERPPEMLPP